MTQQRSSFLAMALVLVAAACGGGTGNPSSEVGQGPGVDPSTHPAGSASSAPVGPSSVAGVGATPSTGSAAESTPPPQFSREWFVAPNGNDGGEGSAQAPLKTIQQALTRVGPGEAIRVQPGTYAETLVIADNVQAGQDGAPITLLGDGMPKLVHGGGIGAVVQIERPHWVVSGFEIDVEGKPLYAVSFKGDTTGSALTQSNIHHGSLGAGVTTFGGAREVTIEGNEIHHFSRGNDDSHGVIVQPTSVNVEIRGNRIHDNSGDSVQCIGPEPATDAPAQGLVIEDNEMFANREQAVDLKTCSDIVVRRNRMYGFPSTDAIRGTAMVAHYSVKNLLIEENEIYDAGLGIALGGNRTGPMPTGVVIRHNSIHDMRTVGSFPGNGLQIENSQGAQVLNNTLTGIDGYAIDFGHGTGGATEGLVVKNNVLDSGLGLMLGEQAPGLAMDANLYRPGSKVKVGANAPLELDGWKQLGHEARSVVSTDANAGVDRGVDVGLPFCGAAPDIGATESGC